MLTSHWTPPPGYRFPTEKMYGKNRSFSSDWLKVYPWLVYSPSINGAFCFPCVLFGCQSGHNNSKLDKLYQSPLTNWVKAAQKLSEHNTKSEVHKQSMVFCKELKSIQEKHKEPIKVQINKIQPWPNA